MKKRLFFAAPALFAPVFQAQEGAIPQIKVKILRGVKGLLVLPG